MFGFDPPVKRTGPETFTVDLPPHVRSFMIQIAEELGEVAESDHPATRRLFPTAYPGDPEKDAGYQILSRDSLIDSRRDAITTLLGSADDTEISAETLGSWMKVINDARLVLGTILYVSEDHEPTEDDDMADVHDVFDFLGYLLSLIIGALDEDL